MEAQKKKVRKYDSERQLIYEYIYNEEEVIGKGSHAIVYKGVKHSINGRKESGFAIKVLDTNSSAEFLAWCKDKQNPRAEIVLEQLKHNQHIMQMEVIQDGGTIYMISKQYEWDLGKYASKQHRDNKYVAYGKLVFIGKCILGALEESQRLRIIHRDLKPANVLLANMESQKYEDDPPEVVVADWGESRTNSEKNTTGRGTYNISAPDVFGKENYNLEVDIWSFGSLMYEVIWNKELITRREFYQLVALPSQEGSESFHNQFYGMTRRFKDGREVELRAHQLAYRDNPPRDFFVAMIIDILRVDPKERPSAKHLLDQFPEEKFKEEDLQDLEYKPKNAPIVIEADNEQQQQNAIKLLLKMQDPSAYQIPLASEALKKLLWIHHLVSLRLLALAFPNTQNLKDKAAEYKKQISELTAELNAELKSNKQALPVCLRTTIKQIKLNVFLKQSFESKDTYYEFLFGELRGVYNIYKPLLGNGGFIEETQKSFEVGNGEREIMKVRTWSKDAKILSKYLFFMLHHHRLVTDEDRTDSVDDFNAQDLLVLATKVFDLDEND